jgi:hypothetical protein
VRHRCATLRRVPCPGIASPPERRARRLHRFARSSTIPSSRADVVYPPDEHGGFLALRDKDGSLARLMNSTGAIDDGIFSVADEQRVLYEALREQGNPVSLDIMPGSTHMSLSE